MVEPDYSFNGENYVPHPADVQAKATHERWAREHEIKRQIDEEFARMTTPFDVPSWPPAEYHKTFTPTPGPPAPPARPSLDPFAPIKTSILLEDLEAQRHRYFIQRGLKTK